ncbi:SUKH-4 family immunity protein [Saccharothrix sp. ST-888]|uniref:SUKH-4 family immunity protein n=1 Tax=Saccharothrix sp. ST-888 TaxID=1427391 RepID=UPI0005ED357F|nr:SUKH-4 family immunity protein [Saccharothrix sp. ST-888]KJK56697.1 hypothetical protein UK12_20940 [Saccharothrix sp. ST-888]
MSRDEAVLAAAVEEARGWLTGPERAGRLYVGGVSGAAQAGRTALLEALRAEFPEALYLDAGGLSAEGLVRGLVEQLDPAQQNGLDSLDDLERLFRSDKEPRIVLVANTQWAGALSTSGEPARVAEVLTALGYARERAPFKLITEVASVPQSPPAGCRVIELPGSSRSEIAESVRQGLPPRAVLALRALAHAQLRAVPVEAWAALCRAAEVEVAEDELLGWADELPWLSVTAAGLIGFRSAAVAPALRELPGTASESVHRRMAAALQSGTPADWASRSLPGHAAAAGSFDDLLADPAVLARIPQEALLEGFGAGYPAGIAQGTHAAALHYLAGCGPAGVSHGEWVAWLSHDAFTRGRFERAAQLAEASPEPLPFTTVWSHWRASGDFTRPAAGLTTEPIGVAAVSWAGSPAVFAEDEDGNALVRAAATGELLAGPLAAEEEPDELELLPEDSPAAPRWLIEADGQDAEVFDAGDGRRLGVLRHPGTGQFGVVGDLVVVAGSQGTCALRIEPSRLRQEPGRRPTLSALPYGEVLARPYEGAEREDTRALLERVFGPEDVHRLRPADVPAGVGHEPTRRVLTEVGVPEVAGLIGLWLDPLTAEGLGPRPWESVEEAQQPDGSGPFYSLGEWMGCPLLLDGADGRVLRMLPADASEWQHPREPLVGTDLRSFLTMVALESWYLDVHRAYRGPDQDEVLAELRLRLAGVDPEAAARDCWEYALEPDNWG